MAFEKFDQKENKKKKEVWWKQRIRELEKENADLKSSLKAAQQHYKENESDQLYYSDMMLKMKRIAATNMAAGRITSAALMKLIIESDIGMKVEAQCIRDLMREIEEEKTE